MKIYELKLTSHFLILILFISLGKRCFGQIDSIEMYAFGHSLIDHRSLPDQEETTILYWMYDIANHANEIFRTTGQYGFLPTHDNLPPNSNWGYPTVPYSWDESQEAFSDSDLTTILLTAGNYIQGTPPNDPHPEDNSTTAIQSTETIFDWTNTEKANMRYYIYANWPEIVSNSFPPPQNLIDDFHDDVISGNFADWWETYHDSIMNIQPELEVRMIPVGQIISKLHRSDTIIPTPIPFEDLYEDNAPHGKPTTYFLAGMITYMAMYEKKIPEDYMPSDTVHMAIRDSLSAINDFIWQELMNYEDDDGVNRVFHEAFLPIELTTFEAFYEEENIRLIWETELEKNFNKFIVEESIDGQNFTPIGEVLGKNFFQQKTSYSFYLPKNEAGKYYYRLKLLDNDSKFSYSPIKSVIIESNKLLYIGNAYPNPSSRESLHIPYSSKKDVSLRILLYDQIGKSVLSMSKEIHKGQSTVDLSVSHIPGGIYFLIIESNGEIQRQKIILN